MGEDRPRRIDELAALRSFDHPVLTYDIGSGFAPPAYAIGRSETHGAVAVRRRSDRGHLGLAVIGAPPAVRSLLVSDEVRDLALRNRLTHVSVPRAAFGLVADLHPWAGGGEGDWLWTMTSVAPVRHEERIEVADESMADEIVDFLGSASPRTHGEPFARENQVWVTIRERADLIACGSWDLATSGIPVLAGIAVAPTRRGEGYGAAVTAYLTRAAVREFGACTLGMFADNVTARRLYHGLGYRTGAQWSSRWFASDLLAANDPAGDRRGGTAPARRTAACP